ncbi:MAG: ClpXP protease specificity-enhancing factor SspB [Sandaracinaceae bacterium]
MPRVEGAMSEAGPPPKPVVARALLERGSLFVHLDPRRDGVVVPPWFANQEELVLQFGFRLPLPIPDLFVDEEDGISGTLSFNRAPHSCRVPWPAVYAMSGDDGMGVVWEEDLPTEVAVSIEERRRKANRPALRAVPSEPTTKPTESAATDDAGGDTDPATPRPRPHLRLVK